MWDCNYNPFALQQFLTQQRFDKFLQSVLSHEKRDNCFIFKMCLLFPDPYTKAVRHSAFLTLCSLSQTSTDDLGKHRVF